MGGNESREVACNEFEVESDGGIYRDLLETDGCESEWRGRAEPKEESGMVQAKPGSGLPEDVSMVVNDNKAEVIKDEKTKAKEPQEDADESRSSINAELAPGLAPLSSNTAPSTFHNPGRISILTDKHGNLLLTSTGRPLGEPPVLDYDNVLTSDGKLRAIFGDDVERRSAYLDAHTEWMVMSRYMDWAESEHFRQILQIPMPDYRFRMALREETRDEEWHLKWDLDTVLSSLTPLQEWESRNLDNDDNAGNTASLRAKLEIGQNPFYDPWPGRLDAAAAKDAQKKYAYLMNGLQKCLADDMETWLFYRRERGTKACEMNDESFLELVDYPSIFGRGYYGGADAEKEFAAYDEERGGLHNYAMTNCLWVLGSPHDPVIEKNLISFWEERVWGDNRRLPTPDERSNQQLDQISFHHSRYNEGKSSEG